MVSSLGFREKNFLGQAGILRAAHMTNVLEMLLVDDISERCCTQDGLQLVI